MPSTDARVLGVLIGSVPVGRLTLEDGGAASFVFFASYRARYPRPVLGQAFEDDLAGRYVGRSGRLPVWFSNLLPEGPLRDQVQDEIGQKKRHEFRMIAALGEDLPGALRLTDAGTDPSVDVETTYEAPPPEDPHKLRIRFALAGMQLKLSVRRTRSGALTLPARGVDGEVILKLPDPEHPGIPTNEHAMMTWARRAGMDVPAAGLVQAVELETIPRELFARDEAAYYVIRFDRGPEGRRVHMEDMAQVFGLYPEDKYSQHTYESIARVVRAVAGETGFEELLRRYAFMIGIGNSDMHHKNWSLLYPDGFRAKLAPAYDLVATIVYPSLSAELALKLGGQKRFVTMHESTFDRFAADVGADRARVREVVAETLEALCRRSRGSVWI
jgi:serine/threonine-protein kinase HipA